MWAVKEFRNGLSNFHGRNRSTLVRAAHRISNNLDKSFSAALGVSLRQSVARIFAKKGMDTQQLLEGHYQATIEACAASTGKMIVVAQDTTYYNLSSHKSMSGLGPLQGKIRGTLQHNVLAMEEDGVPIGLLHQHNWTRGGLAAPTKESEKWVAGLKAVNSAASAIAKPILLDQDREADFFEFLAAERAENVSILVRVFQPRTLELMQEGVWNRYRLEESFEALSSDGDMSVEIFRDGKPVTLRLSVRSGPVNVLPNRDKQASTPKLENLRLVVATEVGAVDSHGVDVFEASEAAEWILLTTLSADSGISAMEIVGFYAFRWRIERLHYVQKSGGLRCEKLQFDDVQTFFNALAFYSIIACRMIRLTYGLRQDAEQPATRFFSTTELGVIMAAVVADRHGSARKLPPPDVGRLGSAVQALARLEGFAPSKKQPYPGAKVLGAALVRLNRLVEGFALASSFSLQD